MTYPLHHASAVPPTPARAHTTPASALLRAWWRYFCMDERERFLSQATNTSELEQRMRQWDDRCVTRSWHRGQI